MKRIYIAGPMTGLPEFNYPAFRAASARWRAAGWRVRCPTEAFDGDQSRTYAEFMRADVAMLLDVEAVAVLLGWEQSRGARFEVHLAQILGLPIYCAESMAPLTVPLVYTACSEVAS